MEKEINNQDNFWKQVAEVLADELTWVHDETWMTPKGVVSWHYKSWLEYAKNVVNKKQSVNKITY